MKFLKIQYILILILICVFMAVSTNAYAELKIDSVYPSLGKMGENLNVNLTGSGFDANTWVSMYVDSGNKKRIIGSVDTPGVTFISQMTPPAGKNRLIFTSALNEDAIFCNDGTSSFSFQFWANIFGGADLYNAFVMAKKMVEITQTASLDFNGNGIPNEKEDKTLADTHIVIGRGYVPAGDMPYIGGVSKNRL